jgi:hypothetical protein
MSHATDGANFIEEAGLGVHQSYCLLRRKEKLLSSGRELGNRGLLGFADFRADHRGFPPINKTSVRFVSNRTLFPLEE